MKATRLLTAICGGLLAIFVCAAPGSADQQERGKVTNLPIPRYVSIKASEANVRRGPGLTHRIDWIFKRRDMPVEVTAEFEHWRRVRDRDGASGWVHYSLLSGVRTVIIDQDLLELRARPDEASPIKARLEMGVIARFEECSPDWCGISTGGFRGWSHKAALWGVGQDEIRE